MNQRMMSATGILLFALPCVLSFGYITVDVCSLDTIVDPDHHCSQVSTDACEGRSKLGSDGHHAACVLDGGSCKMSDTKVDCTSDVCHLNTIVDPDHHCSQVSADACESRSKLRSEGHHSACVLDAGSCKMSDGKVDCTVDVCYLDTITAADYHCSMVSADACESRSKMRSDGHHSPCVLDGGSCTMSDMKADCASAVCSLDAITATAHQCAMVSSTNCESRSKLRSDGSTSACMLDGGSCKMSDTKVYCPA